MSVKQAEKQIEWRKGFEEENIYAGHREFL